MNDRNSSGAAAGRRVVESWFALTPAEQKAVALVLFLFLLGIAVRFWRDNRGSAQDRAAEDVRTRTTGPATAPGT